MQKHRHSCLRRRYSCSWALLFLLIGISSAFLPISRPSGAPTVSFFAATDRANSMAEPSAHKPTSPTTDKDTPESCDNNNTTGDMRFGKFVIPEASVFLRSSNAAAFVNLRPIVPGHVLVIPHKIVPHMADLDETDYTSLWSMVRKVQSTLQKAYPDTTAFNVAVQDGRAAGQSIPHVHVHILPRSGGDFERNDDVYDALEAWAPTEELSSAKEKTDMEVPDDADRIDRTAQMMADEAAMYRNLVEEDE